MRSIHPHKWHENSVVTFQALLTRSRVFCGTRVGAFCLLPFCSPPLTHARPYFPSPSRTLSGQQTVRSVLVAQASASSTQTSCQRTWSRATTACRLGARPGSAVKTIHIHISPGGQALGGAKVDRSHAPTPLVPDCFSAAWVGTALALGKCCRFLRRLADSFVSACVRMVTDHDHG